MSSSIEMTVFSRHDLHGEGVKALVKHFTSASSSINIPDSIHRLLFKRIDNARKNQMILALKQYKNPDENYLLRLQAGYRATRTYLAKTKGTVINDVFDQVIKSMPELEEPKNEADKPACKTPLNPAIGR